jgi:hypothetical protein
MDVHSNLDILVAYADDRAAFLVGRRQQRIGRLRYLRSAAPSCGYTLVALSYEVRCGGYLMNSSSTAALAM